MAIRARVLAEQPWCTACGVELDLSLPRTHPASAQVDHIIPVSRGGAMYDRANLTSMCRACNREKSDRMPGEKPGKQAPTEPRTFVTSRTW
jgi:5-methylcytosine-specific restriction endonuclease McrA